MGGTTIAASLSTYFVASRYADEPHFAALITVFSAMIIFTIGHIIVNSFEKIIVANRMKTEFVRIASHQLRTPLSISKWAIEALLLEKIDSLKGEQLKHIEMVRTSNNRMIRLVNDLLNVTRIDQGKLVLKKEKFDLKALAKDLVGDFEGLAKANHISLEVESSTRALSVYADEQCISTVIGNLVDNAVRYISKNGKVKVIIQNKGSLARVEVRDNGVGIPKGEHNNIFQKFFRSKNVMRHRTEGSGLGLYVSKAFIELHHGKIGFNSSEGKGSTFWFEIPAK